MGQSAKTVHMLTKPQVFYNNNLKQALGFQNPFYLKKAQQIRPMLYDGSVIANETNVISIADSEETLMLKEESRSKMLLKQTNPMVLEKKVNIKSINHDELNRLSKDFDLLNEVKEVQIVFNQMEAAIQQYFIDKQCFEIHKKELFLENDRLLQKIMSQDVMICVMNSIAVFDDVNVEKQSSESYVKCVDLDV
ncbi:hypothetical protein Tco_0587922 [Tanacetum coccineum]